MRQVIYGLFCLSLVAFAYGHSAVLKKAAAGDLKSLNEAFSLYSKSDGGDAEDIEIAIGKSIAVNPKNFLIALKKNRALVKSLGGMVGNLGEDFVDQPAKQQAEKEKRVSALHKVADASLVGLRDECVSELKKQISAFREQ